MRTLLYISLAIITLGCFGAKKATQDMSQLYESWVPIKQEMNGNALPPLAMQGQKLILKDSTYIAIAESVDKGVVHYNGNKMDIYGKDGVNKGKHFTAIYKYENGELTICYNLAGDAYPEDFITVDKPAYFLSVFRKQMRK